MVIDGLDGSGKSTQANKLANLFTGEGRTVCLRVHPSEDNFFGAKAKLFLYSEGKSAHFAASLFYMLDVIRSIVLFSWRKFEVIIFVRYLMGTAYLPRPLHKVAYCFFTIVVPKSDNMFFLDVTPEEAYWRIRQNRSDQEMFEDIDDLRKVRAKALSLTAMGKWKIVDADKPANQVSLEIRKQISSIKNNRK